QAGPVAPDRRLEACRAGGIDPVVDPVHPLGIRSEPPLPRHVERQVDAEPVALGQGIDQVAEGHASRHREIAALAVMDLPAVRGTEPLARGRRLAGRGPGRVDEETGSATHDRALRLDLEPEPAAPGPRRDEAGGEGKACTMTLGLAPEASHQGMAVDDAG